MLFALFMLQLLSAVSMTALTALVIQWNSTVRVKSFGRVKSSISAPAEQWSDTTASGVYRALLSDYPAQQPSQSQLSVRAAVATPVGLSAARPAINESAYTNSYFPPAIGYPIHAPPVAPNPFYPSSTIGSFQAPSHFHYAAALPPVVLPTAPAEESDDPLPPGWPGSGVK